MGAKNIIHSVVVIIGFIIIALSIFADIIGIGSTLSLGPTQIIGIILGLIIVIVGYVLKPKVETGKPSK